jgi:predicted nucleic acid-binding Zn ribbon protein
MVYFDVKPLGDLIKEFYEQHRGSDYLDEIKLINTWPKVVGPFIASHTIDLSIKNQVLFVRVDSDALRNELNYSKSLLIKNLNEMVGKEMVTEIVLQ